ncbi:MAG: hypothetical protein NVS3B7_07570 [Candidatus Elarobacter sp.]
MMAVTAGQKRAAIGLSIAAYCDEGGSSNQAADMRKALSAIPAAANGPWKLVWGPASTEGILAYVAVGNDETTYAVAFRGSLTDLDARGFLDNWVVNGDTFRQVPWLYPSGGAVKVSAGMNQALAYALMLVDPTSHAHLLDFLRSLVAGGSTLDLMVTGHSLGGALAQLASQWLYSQLVQTGKLKGVHVTPVTFAAPTTGNQQFATLFQTSFPSNYACVNTLDIVPKAWHNLDGIQRSYPPPGQSIAEFGVSYDGLLALYKDSLGVAYQPVTAPAPDTFTGWMPQKPAGFAQIAAVNHSTDTYLDHIRTVTGIY